MTFKQMISQLKKDGFKVLKNPHRKGLYQIQDIANLEGVTFSEAPVDYRISFWQMDEDKNEIVGVQTAVKSVDVLYSIITNLTW